VATVQRSVDDVLQKVLVTLRATKRPAVEDALESACHEHRRMSGEWLIRRRCRRVGSRGA